MKTNKISINLFIIFFFLLYAIFISYPLINNLHSILLPKNYSSPSFSDIFEFINILKESEALLFKNKVIFHFPPYAFEPSITFNYFGILLGFFIKNKIVIVNLFFLLVIAFSGYGSFLITNYFIRDKLISILAGILYITSNNIFHHYYWGHLNLIQMQYIPIIILLFLKLSQESRLNLRLTAITGFFYSLQLFSSTQYAIYLTVILLFCFLPLILFKNFKNIKILFINFIFTSLTFLIISGYYIYKRLNYQGTIIRSLEENLTPGFRLNSLLNLVDPNHKAFVGVITIFYFLISVIYLFLKIERNNKIWFWSLILMFIFSLLFMFGPITNLSPYYILYRYFPLINKFRVPLRFFPFLLLSIINICTLALSTLLKGQSAILKIIFILLLWLSLIMQYLSSSYFIGRYLYDGIF